MKLTAADGVQRTIEADRVPSEHPVRGRGHHGAGLEALASVWSTGIGTGVAIAVPGLLMIALTKGMAAVVFWPLGAFAVIVGVTVLATSVAARRATQRMARDLAART